MFYFWVIFTSFTLFNTLFHQENFKIKYKKRISDNLIFTEDMNRYWIIVPDIIYTEH